MQQADIDPDRFATTSWSLVMGIGASDASTAHASLLTLCLRYWYPVYAYLRRSGHAPERAHDLARSFFQELLRNDGSPPAAIRYGRFRLFLQAELNRFLSANHSPAPPSSVLTSPSLDAMESRHRSETSIERSPEEMLRRGFAIELLGAAHKRLRREASQAGHAAMFDELERFLSAEPHAGEYEAIAQRLSVRPLFVSMAVKRLRQRFRELVDQELSETLASAGDMNAERQTLLQALGSEPA